MPPLREPHLALAWLPERKETVTDFHAGAAVFPSVPAKSSAVVAQIVQNADLVVDMLVAAGKLELIVTDDGLVFRFPLNCAHRRVWWEDTTRVCKDCGERFPT